MEHIVNVGMDVDTLKQLDNLRRAHPNVPSRVEVIRRLDLGRSRQGRSGAVPRRVIPGRYFDQRGVASDGGALFIS